MPLTASLGGDAPSPPVPSPSPWDGGSNDPSHTLPSFAFVIYQLSLLLSSLGSTAVDAFARQQLLAALSNVLSTSIHLRQLSISSPSTAVQAASSSPRHLTHHRAATPRNPATATSLLSHLTLTLARQRPLTVAEPHYPRANARSAVLPSTSPLPAQATSQSLALVSAIPRRRPHTCRVAPLCHTARS